MLRKRNKIGNCANKLAFAEMVTYGSGVGRKQAKAESMIQHAFQGMSQA